ncbi:hypothetical protein J6590_052702 [Homalodisca vitripennis]|nr:hypothetical protein J6590_052702 [Homalodisca vitripennis]
MHLRQRCVGPERKRCNTDNQRADTPSHPTLKGGGSERDYFWHHKQDHMDPVLGEWRRESQATYTHFYRSLYPIAAQRLPHNLRSQPANLAGIILPEPVQKNSGW